VGELEVVGWVGGGGGGWGDPGEGEWGRCRRDEGWGEWGSGVKGGGGGGADPWRSVGRVGMAAPRGGFLGAGGAGRGAKEK
jgi:hypothetical protein